MALKFEAELPVIDVTLVKEFVCSLPDTNTTKQNPKTINQYQKKQAGILGENYALATNQH